MNINEDAIIATLFGALSTVFWYMLKARDKRLDKCDTEIDRIRDNYQKRDDAKRDFDIINDSLKEIKTNTRLISEKLDKKADK
ncbi:MAG: hypothetical protein KGV50_00295 [Gammaproteobacteria bacterium]|nr:hypothetical protein [Gammaproteobacteria bacterium]